MKSLKIALFCGAALVALSACSADKSGYSSDWCISTDGLTFEERVWANEVCSRGGDYDFDREVKDRSDRPVPGDNIPGDDDAPGNSGDAPGRNK